MACVPTVPISSVVAVGRGFRDDVGADRAAGAAAVVDHHRRLQRLAQHLRERPRHDVGRPAGRKRHDDADLLARERLCARRIMRVITGRRAERRGQAQKLSATHGGAPKFAVVPAKRA